MRKLLVLAVAGVLAWLPASPLFAVDLKVDGDFRIRGFYNNNLTDANSSIKDNNAYNSERFIINFVAKSGTGPVNVEGVVTTDLTSSNGTGNSRFGNVAFGPNSSSAVTCGGGTPTACTQNTFTILQAYIKLNTPVASFAAGRQVFKLGHGLLVADAVDAFVLDVPLGAAKLTLGDLKIFDSTRSAGSGGVFIGNGTSGLTGGDTDLYVANIGVKPNPTTKADLFVGLYKDRTPTFISQPNPALPAYGTSANAEALIFGAAGETKLGIVHGIFEADLIRGVVKDPLTRGALLQGHNIYVGGDVNVMFVNLGLSLVHASGQDAGDLSSGKRTNINGINGDFPLGIIVTNVGARSPAPVDGTCPSFSGGGLGGRPGCFAGSGLNTIKFAAIATPPALPKLGLEFDVLYNKAARDRPIQSAAGSPNFIKGGDEIGTELDFFLRYAITKELSFTAGLGMLFPGNWFEAPTAATVGIGGNPTTQNASNLTVGVLEMRYQF
ncbi:MAG TPA: hypothetical protein VGJ57_01455 [Nitrospirales bacterium]|jgi:hypothetical protein